MLIRQSSPRLSVTQPTHAMVSADIGKCWGNDSFMLPPLMTELLFATGIHDIGFLDWEQAPTLNTVTGQPDTYLTLPHAVHIENWKKGIQWLGRVSRFAALMASLHSRGLYATHFKWEEATEEDRDLVEAFMKEQCDWQEQVTAELIKFPRYAHCGEIGMLEQYSHLMGTWDVLSLHICGGGMTAPALISDVPAGSTKVTLSLEPLNDENTSFTLKPWPFSVASLNLEFEGRVMEEKYDDTDSLRKSITAAPVEIVEVSISKSQADRT